jgi:hypothetical protein
MPPWVSLPGIAFWHCRIFGFRPRDYSTVPFTPALRISRAPYRTFRLETVVDLPVARNILIVPNENKTKLEYQKLFF